MTFQTVQARYAAKHLDRISNVQVFVLDNNFEGAQFGGTVAQWAGYALDRMGGKLQIDKAAGKGRVRLHSNCWYEFDYAGSAK